jgi:two-component system, OmpR family, alkaline phosphatase synthesis response regulator PhoP
MTAPTILVVEDEAAIRTVVRTYLEHEGYHVILAENGREAISLAREQRPDLVILDLMLPAVDGSQVAARLRQDPDASVRDVYILMLTARSEEADRVAGLRLGADDYLTKPFSPPELVARVQAILRRRRDSPPPGSALHFAHLSIDPDRHEARTSGGLLELTTTEFNLLWELTRHAGRVLSREQLLDRVWGFDFYGTERVVDVYVGQIRRKLEQASGLPLIQTVRGVGYKFVDSGAE